MNPNSKLWLCKCDLENDYRNTLTFASATAQRNYFVGDPNDSSSYGIATKMYNEFTYLRLEHAIKVDDLIDNIDTNNYLVLLNNSKYYYYFITSMEYIDSETTKIHIELDVMQTYLFDIVYKPTFVEREHVVDDVAGKHTIPEGLETGEFVSYNSGNFGTRWTQNSYTMGVVIALVFKADEDYGLTYSKYGGIFQGSVFLFCDSLSDAQWLLENQPSENVVGVFMYPMRLTTPGSEILIDGHRFAYLQNSDSANEYEETILASKPSTIGSYTPRNKKLLTKEYTYLFCDNGSGNGKTYAYEDFSTTAIKFKEISVLTIGGSIIHAPVSYKGVAVNQSESFANAKFPICSYVSDSYTNWLTQNAVNSGASIVGKDILESTIGLGMMALNPIVGGPMVASGFANAVGDMKKIYDQKKMPDSIAGNVSCGDINYAYNLCRSVYYQMSIKEEYARIIDFFFDQFGYKVNTLKTPSIHTRTYWNYLKTKNCNFAGNIPQEYMLKIKNIFDNGITFWHDPSKFLDYSQTNSVIS